MLAEIPSAPNALPLGFQYTQFAIIAFGVSCTAIGLLFTSLQFRDRNRLARRQRLAERNIRQFSMDQTATDSIRYFRTTLEAEDRPDPTATAENYDKGEHDEDGKEEQGEAQ